LSFLVLFSLFFPFFNSIFYYFFIIIWFFFWCRRPAFAMAQREGWAMSEYRWPTHIVLQSGGRLHLASYEDPRDSEVEVVKEALACLGR
jgi:hypothetical protein